MARFSLVSRGGAIAFGVLVVSVGWAPPATAKVCDGVTVPCVIGDTGPGGGIVFYDAGARQEWGQYIEVAPAGWATQIRPDPPREVTVKNTGDGIKVSWRPGAGDSTGLRYQVLILPTSKGCTTDNTSCTFRGLKQGRTYTVKVVAEKFSLSSNPSREILVSIPPTSVQPTPKPKPTYRSFRAATADPWAEWCSYLNDEGHWKYLATRIDIGTGAANTQLVVSVCGDATAAGLASAYQGGGEDDWFLPSKDELNALYLNRHVVQGMGDNVWSSSQVSDDKRAAWAQYFFNGDCPAAEKSSVAAVRPVRYL